MKGFTPTEESYGFNPDLLWSGLRSGCRVTKSRRSRSESAKLIGATGLPAVFFIRRSSGGLASFPVGLHRRHG